MAVTNFYGVTNRETGDSTHGQNTVIHYYDKAGVKAANAIAVYAQFADRRARPLKMGTTYKVSKWLHIFDREVGVGEFGTKGYLSARNVVDVSAGIQSDAALPEVAGIQNKQTIKKVTIEAAPVRLTLTLKFGEREFEMNFKGTVKDSALTGELTTSRGTSKIVGRKVAKQGRRQRRETREETI